MLIGVNIYKHGVNIFLVYLFAPSKLIPLLRAIKQTNYVRPQRIRSTTMD